MIEWVSDCWKTIDLKLIDQDSLHQVAVWAVLTRGKHWRKTLSTFIQISNLPNFHQTYPFSPSIDPSFVFKYCGFLQGNGIPDAIATSVLGNINLSRVYRELDDNMMASAVNDVNDHIFTLIKVICNCYCKIGLYHLWKEFTAKMTGKMISKKLTKLVQTPNTNPSTNVSTNNGLTWHIFE